MQNMLSTLLLLAAAFSSGMAHADYLAYSVQDGGKRALPEDISQIDSKFLLNMEWGAHSGNQVRVGVLPVDNQSRGSSIRFQGNGVSYSVDPHGTGVPVDGIEAMLTDVMLKTGRYRLVERTELDSTLKEQDLGASGRVSKPSAAKIGKVLGAEYLIKAVVTSYEPNFKGSSFGIGGLIPKAGLLGGIGIKNNKSMVGMNFRLIDAETSEVIYSQQVEAIISESGLSFGGAGFGSGGALGGFMSNYSKTPIGQAVIVAVNKGVYEILKQTGNAPLEAAVMKVSGNKIYVNAGAGVVSKGDVFTAVSVGEELVDPKTGLKLGAEEEEVGKIQILQVKDKYSIAKPLDLDPELLSVGDKLVGNKQAAPIEFAAAWAAPAAAGGSGETSTDEVLK